jgi:structural maintenance of chromosome 2
MDSKIAGQEKELNALKTENENLEKESKRVSADISRCQKEVKETQEDIFKMERAYTWLTQEYDNFGEPDSEYDFDRLNMNEERKKLEGLKKEQDGLSKRVNMKVETMSDKVEKEFKSLLEKRSILETDKMTLVQNIEELDKKKKEALEKCWSEVNANFGRIFSTLLHGAFAKVQPVNGIDLADGLELKVAFNNNWKNSLSELSGGQRSLLALSFMLALLLHKPAPFYILDEIDAALDLSHTENIGAMISQHFPQSQFIIISLKEEMFNNANVLFKTSFVDGVSKVDRFLMKSSKPLQDHDGKNKKKVGKKNEDKENMMMIEEHK